MLLFTGPVYVLVYRNRVCKPRAFVYRPTLQRGFRLQFQYATELAELQVFPDDRNKVDPESLRVLWQLDQPFSNHNGGEVSGQLSSGHHLTVQDNGQA